MAITKTTVLEDGNVEQEFSCRSKQCTNYKKVVEKVINLQKTVENT